MSEPQFEAQPDTLPTDRECGVCGEPARLVRAPGAPEEIAPALPMHVITTHDHDHLAEVAAEPNAGGATP